MMIDERDALEEEFFDIDAAERLSRRGFNKFLTLGSLAAVVGAAGTLTDGCAKTYSTIVVAHAGDIPVGGWKIFSYPADVNPCILLRPEENTYLAYSRICTHTSCPVFFRPEQNLIVCQCHGGAYSVVDGSVLAGPPPRPLPKITLERRGDDLVATGVVKG
ncbi:MAG TPA: ubiquinol-cytochrome c reductase iron-sulfur subunit [Candidatus Acidoferrales bacterium]|nr:ubiquinol-cytochrome c reductase iron-sulfur subunit [Candidatus Acidoferrales bacterium]